MFKDDYKDSFKDINPKKSLKDKVKNGMFAESEKLNNKNVFFNKKLIYNISFALMALILIKVYAPKNIDKFDLKKSEVMENKKNTIESSESEGNFKISSDESRITDITIEESIIDESNSTESLEVDGEDIREIAYNQLSLEDKNRLKGNWKDGTVSKVEFKIEMGNITDHSYIGEEVYMIDFPTHSTGIPNNMIFFLTIDTNKLIGYGYID